MKGRGCALCVFASFAPKIYSPLWIEKVNTAVNKEGILLSWCGTSSKAHFHLEERAHQSVCVPGLCGLSRWRRPVLRPRLEEPELHQRLATGPARGSWGLGSSLHFTLFCGL